MNPTEIAEAVAQDVFDEHEDRLTQVYNDLLKQLEVVAQEAGITPEEAFAGFYHGITEEW
jgi:hypothetical protein